MFRTKTLAAIAAMLMAIAASAFAQTQPNALSNAQPNTQQNAQPDAKELLKQVGETYRNLKSYHFEGVVTMEMKDAEGMRIRMEVPVVRAVSKPGKIRWETKGSFMGTATVSDGQTTWQYTSILKQYTKKAVAKVKPDAEEGSGVPALSLGLPLAAPAVRLVNEHIADRVKDARILREEAVEVGGQRINCYVVEVTYGSPGKAADAESSPKTYSIDKERLIVLRSRAITNMKSSPLGAGAMEMIETTALNLVKINEPLPDSLFVFNPPTGAKEVEEISLPGMKRVNLTGRESAAFSLKDLDGKPVELQSLRGKVVLLDFWASWCGPCVAELPHIEKIHRDFKDKGLVVLGINDEEAEVARGFMKEKGYTFTSLVDEGKQVALRYEVSIIPQVLLIGRDGKIKWHELGYTPGREKDLSEAVEKVLKGEEPALASSAPGETRVAPRTITVSGGVLQGSAIKKVQPPYPPQAKADGVEGQVLVRLTISEEGKVIEAVVVSGPEALREAALQAAKQWEFKPTELSGVPVKVQGVLAFNFTLQ